jgi:CRISPR-associated endonuclease/helicase Cas3
VAARPEVAPWLHGIEDNLPETWVAWREEIIPLCESSVASNEEITRWFKRLQIGTQEKLRMPTYRFVDQLRNKKYAATDWVRQHAKKFVVVLSAAGEAKKVTLSELARQDLDFATIILPTELQALNEKGFFDCGKGGNENLDVADEKYHRIVLKRHGDHFNFAPLANKTACGNKPKEEGNGEVSGLSSCLWQSLDAAIKEVESFLMGQENGKRVKRELRLKIQEAEEYQDEDDIEERWLLLFREIDKSTSGSNGQVPTVEEHNKDVAERVTELAEAFHLSESLQEVLQLAGQYHDTGKADDRWQIAAGYEPTKKDFRPKAKPTSGGVDWHKLDGYRHELGSIVDAVACNAIQSHPERDLILHLIATHHGWARPHFNERAFPPQTDSALRDGIRREVMFRYVRLQERFGHWRLAWLESLLRRADGMASASYNEALTEEEGL